MVDKIRELFESTSALTLSVNEGDWDYTEGKRIFPKYPTGEYINPTMEDHWQTFQEGWESAVMECISLFDGTKEMKTIGLLSHKQIIEQIKTILVLKNE